MSETPEEYQMLLRKDDESEDKCANPNVCLSRNS